MRYETREIPQYRWQQDALNEIGKKLGVVVYRPEYHAKKDDHNTVLFYLPEDEAYNRELESQPFYNTNDYKRPFFSFENTDANGFESFDFANHGTIDLRPLGWKVILEGVISLKYYLKRQNQYVANSGGFGGIFEADDTYNGLNISIIKSFLRCHGEAWIGKFNYYYEDHERLANPENPVFEEYTGRRIYTGDCDYILPKPDEKLQEMVRDWNVNHKGRADAMIEQVKRAGGITFVWY